MIREELTPEEWELLLYCVRRWRPELLPKLDTLSSDDIQIIKNVYSAIGDEVTSEGFHGKDQKSYQYGIKLEKLMDKLYDSYIHLDQKRK